MKSTKVVGPLQFQVDYYSWEEEVRKHLKGTVPDLHGVVLNIRFAKPDRVDTARRLQALAERIAAAARAARDTT